MGGSGSGNWWNHSSRPICEGQKRIDLRFMRRRGMLIDGRSGSLSWSLGNEPAGDISFRVHSHGLELIYAYWEGQGERHQVNEVVRFVFTGQRLGGERRWFACSGCGRRCSILYGGAYFRCRKCYRLGYQSQHEAPHWRTLSQAQKLRQKLGGSGSMDELFPARPKGMHRRTYEKVCRKAEILEGRVNALEATYFGRLAERLGIRSLTS